MKTEMCIPCTWIQLTRNRHENPIKPDRIWKETIDAERSGRDSRIAWGC